jgi:DNA-binding protein YbaB
MKKSKKNETKTSDVVGLSYNLVFKVSIPMDESTIDKDTEVIANHIVSALEIASSKVKGIGLSQSMHYGSAPVNIPILERAE